MASKRCERRKSCESKKRYGTVAEAKSAAWRSRVKTGDDIHDYRCPFCHKWHLGHRSARKLF
jgi:hypothetical protein